MNRDRVGVIILQETHTVDDHDINKKGCIKGYFLLKVMIYYVFSSCLSFRYI